VGSSIESAFGEDCAPYPDTKKRDDGIGCALASTEPQLGLPHRLGTVIHKDRPAQVLAKETPEWETVPAKGRGIDPGRYGRFDHAWDADPDTQELRVAEFGFTYDLADCVGDSLHDGGRVRGPGVEVYEHIRPSPPREVEHLDSHPALAEVHPDRDSTSRSDAEDGARASAARFLRADFYDQAFFQELRDHESDRAGAEARCLRERLAAGRPLEQQFAKQGGPGRAAEIPGCLRV
jgi:hypothetical protein